MGRKLRIERLFRVELHSIIVWEDLVYELLKSLTADSKIDTATESYAKKLYYLPL